MHSIKDTVKQLIGKSLDAYNKKYTSPINNRIDNIVAQAGTDNTEIVDARIDSAGVSHTTLNNRILAETKMTDEKLIEYSGSSLSVDDTMPGYLQNIEIKGNTIQNEDNLEDIRSVGDKIEGQELYEIPVLSVGKNLFNPKKAVSTTGVSGISVVATNSDMILKSTSGAYNMLPINYILKPNTDYVLKGNRTILNGKGRPYCEIRDTNGNLLSSNGWTLPIIFTTDNTGFVKILFGCNDNENNASIRYYDIQLEEGTVATPYEPYQEDKLTILSPVQLEKVGDVRDRIIEKDGVWGVEKNVVTYHLKDYTHSDYNAFACRTVLPVPSNVDAIWKSADFYSNLAYTHTHIDSQWNNRNVNSIAINNINSFATCDITSENYVYADVVKMIEDNDIWVKFVTKTPQFIPLPHSQQVKLRTFANKTNISFLTEIEGTIKAQVPKSLGATVNTHTEQISNLNKELDRVKKLEESTVSTVTTESDFTTVEATSNGYFEDVKLEGKTLATVLTCSTNKNYAKWTPVDCVSYKAVEVGKVYTIIAQTNNTAQCGLKNRTSADYLLALSAAKEFICKTITFSKAEELILFTDTEGTVNMKLIILEGDHTQNPPSYFEGLKSVGQSATTSEDATDEIVVSSVKGDGNLVEYIELNGVIVANGKDYTDNKYVRTNYIIVEPNQTYYIKRSTNVLYGSYAVYFYDSNKSYLGYKSGLTSEFTTVTNTKFIRLDMKKANGTANTPEDINNCDFVVSNHRVSEYIPYQSDKKRLLYYNEETQTWEKPILREWDSIEKHSDGKYYYHQRSGEVVLNGSESWGVGNSSNDTTLLMYSRPSEVPKSYTWGICDKFNFQTTNNESIRNTEYIYVDTDINIRINKSRLSTQDVQGFKQWLQANNVTVVYQLAQEKVYECTNIDLITYANETNYVVESGVLSPKTTLKVHSNISNVVSLLQKKVSVLESNMTKYMITQNRMQLASTYSADSVTFKVDYTLCSEEVEYNEDLYNLILNNIMVGKDNYDYNKMFNIILDYASWSQISWDQFDILVGIMDSQHNPPIEEIPTDDEIVEEIPNEII